MNILLSYPRSGSALCRLFIEQVTGNRVPKDIGETDSVSELIGMPMGERADTFKIHYSMSMPKLFDGTLLYLKRNPVEVVMSYTYSVNYHKRYTPEEYCENIESHLCVIENQGELYNANEEYFKRYNGKKFTLFYEEMVNNPLSFIKKLDKIYGISQSDYFSGNIKRLMDDCLALKKTGGLRCNTDGQVYYWTKKLGDKYDIVRKAIGWR